MSGAGAITAVVLLEWTVGWVAVSAWAQSWAIVRRGNFRINAWGALLFGVLSFLALRSAADGIPNSTAHRVLDVALIVLVVLLVAHLVVQWSRTDVPGAVLGYAAGAAGVVALGATGALVEGWPGALAGLELVGGTLLLGGVTNGMLLGHWYLNQPGLKTWALARITVLTLIASVAAGVLGLVAAGRLINARTEGALGLPGSSDSFGWAFFIIWIALVIFTAVIVWAAKRCVDIRSIQSATGLYYVAILTAGVAEFLVRYLMLNAT
ncbi:MAG: hypothetical protein GEU71_16135 [Actinobacteria bacterium]|nr:hypothetical protein [Actinomycetota bacterium]